jgi:hypothetical protein
MNSKPSAKKPDKNSDSSSITDRSLITVYIGRIELMINSMALTASPANIYVISDPRQWTEEHEEEPIFIPVYKL